MQLRNKLRLSALLTTFNTTMSINKMPIKILYAIFIHKKSTRNQRKLFMGKYSCLIDVFRAFRYYEIDKGNEMFIIDVWRASSGAENRTHIVYGETKYVPRYVQKKKKTQNKINIAACRLDVYVTGNIIKKKKIVFLDWLRTDEW